MPPRDSRPSVLLLSTYYAPVIGGAETAAAQLAEFLVTNGHQVTVVTKRIRRDLPEQEVRAGVRVARVRPFGERSALGKWWVLPAMFRELILRRRDHDVVVCIDYRAVGLAALMARPFTGHPVVFQAVTDGVISFARVRATLERLRLGAIAPRIVRLLQRLYNRADAYMCISHAIEAETLAAGVPRERVLYLPNPVDTHLFTPAADDEKRRLRERFGIPTHAHVAVIAARLSREKGIMDALNAWKYCEIPNRLLLIVGPDMPGHPWNLGEEARQFVQREGLSDHVRFVGAVPPHEVPNWLRVADLAIQPSHFEAFGTSAIEAMAAGLPVVASDVGGLRDFVLPGTNGARVPPQQPAALASALTHLLTDTSARHLLSAGALQTAVMFDTDVVLGQFARIIQLLGGSGVPWV